MKIPSASGEEETWSSAPTRDNWLALSGDGFRATTHHLGVLLAYPCFELLLLLHFRDAPVGELADCDSIVAHIKAAVGGYNKSRVYDLPVTNQTVTDALGRAKQICTHEEGIPNVPQTQVFRIIEELHGKGIVFVGD